MTQPIDHTASYAFDVLDPASEERWSLYRCDTCFALVSSADAADHSNWHFDGANGAVERVLREVRDWPAADFWHRDAILRALGDAE